MTLTTTNVKDEYTGDGATVLFNVTFQFWRTSELDVYLRTIATGAEVLQIEGVDYTVTGGNGSTGQVDFTIDTAAPPATVEVHIRRNTTRDQQKDLTPLTKFPSAATEEALDRAAMASQEEEADRTTRFLRIPVTDIPVAPATAPNMELPSTVERAVTGALLGFDVTTGDPIITTAGVSTALTTAYTLTLLDDTSASAARTTLVVPENYDALGGGGPGKMDRVAADTLANQPAAGTFGEGFYVSTDTREVFYSDGAAWTKLVLQQFANASLPAAAQAGRIYIDTDNLTLLRDSGSALVDLRAPFVRGALAGFEMSMSTSILTIGDGECRAGDASDSSIINAYGTVTSFQKNLAPAGWTVGDNQGGRPTADALGADKWHYVFLIAKADGTVDFGFDDAFNATNLLAAGEAGGESPPFIYYRRIGMVKEDGTGTGVLVPFTQHGDTFLWDTLPALDYSQASVDARTPVDITLTSVPPKVGGVDAMFAYATAGNTTHAVITSRNATAISQNTPAASAIDLAVIRAGASTEGYMTMRTNNAAQIQFHSDDSTSELRIQVYGWVDDRNRWD